MHKTTRARIHKALVNAVPYLAGPGVRPTWHSPIESYICFAIESGNHKLDNFGDRRPTQSARMARRMIEERIFPYYSLGGWLEHQAGIRERDLTNNRMQAYRHAWLKQLIKEFSK